MFLQFCNQYAVPKDKLEHFKNIAPQDIVCSQVVKFLWNWFASLISYTWLTRVYISLQKANGIKLKEEDIVVSNVRIDLTRGKDNPLERYSAHAC